MFFSVSSYVRLRKNINKEDFLEIITNTRQINVLSPTTMDYVEKMETD